MTQERARIGQDDDGEALVEYSLLVGVVVSIVISLAVLFRIELGTMLMAISAHFVDTVSRLA
jgi:Flp pilus assembly pilin Flp